MVASSQDSTGMHQDGRASLDVHRLKALRRQCGLSQEAVSEKGMEQRLCLSIASIKRAETGKPVLYRTARHLAVFYGVPVETLMDPITPFPAHGVKQ